MQSSKLEDILMPVLHKGDGYIYHQTLAFLLFYLMTESNKLGELPSGYRMGMRAFYIHFRRHMLESLND